MGRTMEMKPLTNGSFFLSMIAAAVVSGGCSESGVRSDAEREGREVQLRPSADSTSALEQEQVRITGTDVGEALRAGGVPLTYPVMDIPPNTGGPVPGLVSGAATATDFADIDIKVFESAEARAAQERRWEDNRRQLNISREAMPQFMGVVACGPIHLELNADAVREGEQLQHQLVAIMEDRFGSCTQEVR
jgi:hypothetical protein